MQISGCRVHVVTSVLIKIDHFSYGLSTKITPNLMPIWVSIRTTHIANSIYQWDLMSNWKHQKITILNVSCLERLQIVAMEFSIATSYPTHCKS